MKANVKNIVTTVIFLLFIFGFAIACIAHEPLKYSESERRPLAQFPEYSTTDKGFNSDVKSYIAGFDKYVLEQFPLRDTMREIKAFVELKLFNKSDNNDIYIVDGYISQMQPTLHEDSVNKAMGIWNNIYNKYLKDKANKVLVSVIPDKNFFMAEQNGYLSYDYERMLQIVKESCPEFEYVDIFGELELDDYYKTDTHWRQENIIDVAKKLAEALGVADEYSWSFETNKLDRPFYGVYTGQLGLGVDSETIYYLTNEIINGSILHDYENGLNATSPIYNEAEGMREGVGSDPYNFFLSGAKKGPLCIENPNQDNGKELVIFRDSFGSSIAPLLIEGYSKIYVFDIRVTSVGYINQVLLPQLGDSFEGKDVLFLASSMVLNDSSEMLTNH